MAKLRAEYRSTKDYAPLTLRFTFQKNGKPQRLDAKSKIFVDKEYWDSKHYSNSRNAEVRNKQAEVNSHLQEIEKHILEKFSLLPENEITKEWYKNLIDEYYNPKTENQLNESLSYWIQHKIDNAHLIRNSKGGMGLSEERVSKHKTLKKHFLNAFDEKIKVKDFDDIEFQNFVEWAIDDMGYSASYATKLAVDLKSVISYAMSKGVETSKDFASIRLQEIKSLEYDMDVIFLDSDEIAKVENVSLETDELINARKWLLIFCWTGQRGGIFTQKLSPKIFKRNENGFVIEYTQKKGNKPVTVPILPYVQKLYLNNELPYKMTTQKLNKLFPIIAERAGINEMTLGRLQEVVEIDGKRVRRTFKKERPKYEYVKTHIGRRSFASNHYGKMENGAIMAVTGHKKLNTFLSYVNKSMNTHIDAFAKLYSKDTETLKNKAPLRKVK